MADSKGCTAQGDKQIENSLSRWKNINEKGAGFRGNRNGLVGYLKYYKM